MGDVGKVSILSPLEKIQQFVERLEQGRKYINAERMQDDEHGHQVETQSMKREDTRTKLFPVESVGFDKVSHPLV